MLSVGLSLADLLTALTRNNADQDAGFVEHHGQEVVVYSQAQLHNMVDIDNVEVKQVEGAAITVNDVAQMLIDKELCTGVEYRYGCRRVASARSHGNRWYYIFNLTCWFCRYGIGWSM